MQHNVHSGSNIEINPDVHGNEWIKKMWHIHMVEYSLVLIKKKNVILSFAKTWVAHEKSQIEKGKHHIPSLLGKLANQSC